MSKLEQSLIEELLDRFTELIKDQQVKGIVAVDVDYKRTDPISTCNFVIFFATNQDDSDKEKRIPKSIESEKLISPEWDEGEYAELVRVLRGRKSININRKFEQKFFEGEFLSMVPQDRTAILGKPTTMLANQVRPCPGGILISAGGSTPKSTLTTTIKYAGPNGNQSLGEPMVIGSNHGLCGNGQANSNFYQPTVSTPPNRIGYGLAFHKIKYEITMPQSILDCKHLNEFDVCWGLPEAGQTEGTILSLGNPNPIRIPTLSDASISLHGATTQLVENVPVKSIFFRYFTKNNTNVYSCWKRGIRLDRYVTQPGDSGAAYVSDYDGAIIAIHRAYSDDSSIGAPLL